MQTQFETAYANWQTANVACDGANAENEANIDAAEFAALRDMLLTPSVTGADLANKLRVFLNRDVANWAIGDEVAEMLIAEASQASFAGRTN